MEKGTKRLIIGGAVAGGGMLLGAGLVLGAGLAKADVSGSNPQLSLLLELRGDGFDIRPPFDSRLLALASETCMNLNMGASSTSIERDLERRQAGYWSDNAAIDFVVDTQFAMCPWTLPASSRSGSPPPVPAPPQPEVPPEQGPPPGPPVSDVVFVQAGHGKGGHKR